MSSNTRATSKGGKGTKTDKSHKSESGKGSGDKQLKDGNTKSEDLSIKDKVKMLLELTQKPEEEVCLALHECDNDINLATLTLLDNETTGEWETRVKKKKKQPAAAGNMAEGAKPDENSVVSDEWNDAPPTPSGGGGNGTQPGGNERRNRSGGPPRLHGGRGGNDSGGSRGWRGRERHENERNLEEGGGGGGGYRGRGSRGGAGRGGGGRGRGGGRTGGGRYQPRGNRSAVYNKPIDTWDNSNTWDNNTAINSNHNAESWDDFPGADEWSTEEYQGSLADTKVFTPSVQAVPDPASISEPPGIKEQPPIDNQQLIPQQPPSSQSPVPQMVGTLTAAQTQYFSQLQQNNDPLTKQYSQPTQPYQTQNYEIPTTVPMATPQYVAAAPQSYQSSYNVVTGTSPAGYQQQTYNNAPVNQEQVVSVPQQATQTTTQQRTKTQRARVPPPSKIPSSAVEMPGDLNSSIGYLDVQFGAMDLIDGNSSFDSSIDGKYNTNNLETSTGNATAALDISSSGQNGANLDGYSPKASTQGSISSALSQSLSNETIPPTSADHLSNTYTGSNNRNSATVPSTASSAVSSTPLELSKQQQQESHSSYSQPSTYNSYQSKSSSGYNTSNYSGGAQTTTSSYVSNQTGYVNSQSSGGYASGGANSYQNAYSANSSYQTGSSAAATGFTSMGQGNAYASNNQSYPQNASQSVYGANTGMSNSASYNTSTAQYNNYTGQHKLNKDGAYDSNNTTNSGQTATNATSSASLSLSQSTSGSSKTSTTLAKNSNNVVSNIPPGVTPVMSTPYIQVPYFQQPVYSYEDMQLLQQRLPHITTPYYDMSYQTTPTTIATVRDATLGNVGYTIGGDARYAAAAVAAAAGRTDNSASPSPSSTLSVGGQGGGAGLSSGQGQQQVAAAAVAAAAAQQQPLMAGAAPAPYFFATAAFNALAPNYQFGTMYTQLPAATNAHGSSNSTQYPKPAGYGAGYGGYDALGQTQDYSKGGYVGAAGQGQKGGVNTTSAGGSTTGGNDLSAMYAKSHTALGKVNSYEKQGFHSGTPPPFTGALHGSQSAGLAPTGAGYPQVYIPTMAPHQQHHSTHLMQQPLHQMDVRHQGRRMDSGNAGGQRSQASNQSKAGAKQTYQASYWNPS